MHSSHKLLADENVKAKLVEFLIEQGFDTTQAQKGLKDTELFASAAKEGRAILTHDKDFLNSERYPPNSCHGIVLLRIHPPELSKLKSATLKLLNKFSMKDLKGKTVVLREDDVSIFE